MYHNTWDPSSTSSTPNFSANNPFLESSASNRFPALETSQQSFQSSSSVINHTPSPTSSHFQSQYVAQLQYTPSWSDQPSPQSSTFQQKEFLGYVAPQQHNSQIGFATYGQQFIQQPSYGIQPHSPLQSHYTGYLRNQPVPLSPQQYQQVVISQFDPYKVTSTGPDGQGHVQPEQATLQAQTTGPSGQLHPRQFIHNHKVELDSWNTAAWKQALVTFEDLKRAWERRRIELQKYLLAGQYLTAEDISNVNAMIKTSESNIDITTASLIQMQEVLSGYKHSLDAAGKRRVREALNAGLQGLPEWP